MGMFIVESGTECKVKRIRSEFSSVNIKKYVTKKTNVFDKNQVALDPCGKLGCHDAPCTIGYAYEKAGWYGFLEEGCDGIKNDGWMILVPANKVQYA